MTASTYSYLLHLIEKDEERFIDTLDDGEELDESFAETKKQLAELYTFYTLNK